MILISKSERHSLTCIGPTAQRHLWPHGAAESSHDFWLQAKDVNTTETLADGVGMRTLVRSVVGLNSAEQSDDRCQTTPAHFIL